MIRSKLSSRRPLAIAGATFVGLAAALAVAAPASAHHSEVKVKAECETATGVWAVTWTVNSIAPQSVKTYKFMAVEAQKFIGETNASTVTIPGIAVTEGDSYPHTVGQPVIATHRVPGDSTGASLKVKAAWDNGHKEQDWAGAEIEFSGSCVKEEEPPPPATPKPAASLASQCDGSVVVTLENAEDATAPAEFTVAGSGGFKKTVTVKPGKDETETVTVPAANASKITVTEKSTEKPFFDGAPAEPKDCVEPGEPTGSYFSTCDELTFEIINPEDGETVTVTFTPNQGEAKTLTVQPGETKTVSFPAKDGLTVTPNADDLESEPIAWEKPEDCASGGTGGSLPLTGAATGGIAAAAAALLAIGAVLFVIARRRRIRFTA